MDAKRRTAVRHYLISAGAVFLAVILIGSISCKKKAPEPQAKAEDETAAAIEKGKPAEKAKVEEKVRTPEKLKPRERRPSSLDLVEKAAQEGRLDLDTAWIYRFQAMLEPEALPEQYRGRGRIPCGTPVFAEFRGVRDKLAPETLAKLKPYLVRPTDPESIFSKRALKLKQESQRSQAVSSPGLPGSGVLFAAERQQKHEIELGRPDTDMPQWFFPVTVGNIKIWAFLDLKFGQPIADLIGRYRMWERFAELMGRTPLSDGAERDNGGDGLLDIYLVPESGWIVDDEDKSAFVAGYCVATQDAQTSPAYILINGAQQGAGEVEATIAHELFHAFQFAFDTKEEHWWTEGTAVWSEDFIDPNWDTERYYDEDAFDMRRHALLPMVSEEGQHEYGIYLFPFYLAKVYDDWIVRLIWEECPAMAATKAVRKVMDESEKDGFKRAFKTFAYMNWSQDLDPKVVKYPEDVFPDVWHDREFSVDLPLREPFAKNVELPALSAVYYRFQNTSEKEVARPHVVFDLKDFQISEDLSVQAFIKYRNNAPEKKDWTGLNEVGFCLNNPNEDFEWIALTIGNSADYLRLDPALRVRQEADGCSEGATSAFLTYKEKTSSHADNSDPAKGVTAYTDEAFETEVRIRIDLEYDKSVALKREGRLQENWRIRDWRIVSYGGTGEKTTFFEDRDVGEATHFQGIAQRRKTTEELAVKSVSAQKSSRGKMGLVYIIFDEKTGKAVEVQLGSYSVLVEWQGREKLDSLFGDTKWNASEGKFHGSRTVNRENETSLTTFLLLENMMTADKTGSLVGILLPDSKSAKVTGGDGTYSMSGGGDFSGEMPGKRRRRWEVGCRWNLTRAVKPASNK